MDRLQKLYEGKAKAVYATENPDQVVIEYTDRATAFNGLKKEEIADKGELNAKITAHLFKLLEEKGIPTHFLAAEDKEILAKKLDIVMVEVIVRNIVAGSLATRVGMPEGTPLKTPIMEYCYKNDELGDPMINNTHIAAMGLATREEMDQIEAMAWKINDILREYMGTIGIDLIDFKLEFGRYKGTILLGDEISPDTCRFWDKATGEKMDKDRFRRDMGGVGDAYRKVLCRLQGLEV
jgi:phosphoribosylaminoimidazole-succinocarboxamide synthase